MRNGSEGDKSLGGECVKVFHDEGGGATDISKQHFEKHIKSIQPIEATIRNFGTFTFELFGLDRERKGVILLESGFNCGYNRTGPHGSHWALMKLGVSKEIANKIFSCTAMYINFRSVPPEVRTI